MVSPVMGIDRSEGSSAVGYGLPSFLFFREFTHGLLYGLTPLGPETAAGDHQGLGMRRQPIQSSGGQEWMAKKVRPLRGRAMTGDEHAAHFVAFIDHIVEIRGGEIDQGLQPEVIQHEQLRAQIAAQPFHPGAIRSAPMEMLEHRVGIDEQHNKTLPARFMGEGLGEMAFAHARRPADQYVTFLADGPHSWPGGAPAGG